MLDGGIIQRLLEEKWKTFARSHEPAKLIFVISNLLILACIPCRIAGNRHAEDAILVIAVPGSWFLLMFFAGAIRLTGPFVTMVYSMITGDMLTFGIIYTVVLFGFSQSFFFLYKGFPGVKSSLYNSYYSTWMALFQITLGDYNYADLSNTTYPNLSKAVFAIFMVLVPILLLNMLIAMMGNTYAHVIEQSEKEWVKQWAKIVVSLERAVSQKDAHNYLQEYSIKLGPGDDPNNPASEQRGVLIIKSKSKTRAKQRKGAVANWKRVGKVTINELRKRGMTGEELRRIMWGRASFSTPVRASPNIDEPPVSVVTAGFGDALTAALDVMAFAHEIDVSTATEGIPTNMNASQQAQRASSKAALNVQQQKQQTTTTMVATTVTTTTTTVTNNQARATIAKVQQKEGTQPQGQSKLSGLTELIERPIDTLTNVAHVNKENINDNLVSHALVQSNETMPDPFLELAIAAENTDNYDALLEIAKSALATSEASMAIKVHDVNPLLLEHFTMTKVPMADDKVTVAKKQYFVESSDNDLCGGDNLLGTEARLRRIRSANNRFITSSTGGSASTRRRRRDAHHDEDTTSSGSTEGSSNSSATATTTTTTGYRPLLNGPEGNRGGAGSREEARKRSVETIKFGGSVGGENCVVNGVAASNKHQKRRPKTARNRVSPKETQEALRRRESIERNKAVISPPTSPTADPLEPWSTRGIKDMNAILAWREENPADNP